LLSLHQCNFSPVRVPEVVSCKIHARSFCHEIDNNLNESLLLEAI
jgi:hypothetical protein